MAKNLNWRNPFLSEKSTSFVMRSSWATLVAGFGIAAGALFSLQSNPSSISSNPSSKVVWETSILKAMEKAKKENKPILVELYADWCKTCKVLETRILTDKEVQKAIRPFVTVRLNGEEFPNFMERYQAKGFPTLLFLDKYANYIQKIQGLPDKSMVIREAELALKNSDTEKKLLETLKKSPNSIRSRFELGIYYYQSENYSKSAHYFSDVAKQESSDHSEKDLIRQSLYNLALIQMNQGDYTLAIATWDRYIRLYENDSSLSGAHLHRGIAWREKKEYEKALKDLNRAKTLSIAPEEKEFIEEEIQAVSRELETRLQRTH